MGQDACTREVQTSVPGKECLRPVDVAPASQEEAIVYKGTALRRPSGLLFFPSLSRLFSRNQHLPTLSKQLFRFFNLTPSNLSKWLATVDALLLAPATAAQAVSLPDLVSLDSLA